MKEIKCFVVGDSGVGKASLISTYINGEFPEVQESSIFNHFLAFPMIEGKQCQIQVWYANGQDDYIRLRPLAYPGTDVILICFSIDDRESFESVKMDWVEEIRLHLPESPIILVGTKTDVRSTSPAIVEPSAKVTLPISFEEGLSMATEIGAVTYMEISSLFKLGLTELFQEVGKVGQNTHLKQKKERNCKGCVLV